MVSLGQTFISLGLDLTSLSSGISAATALLQKASLSINRQLVSSASSSFSSIIGSLSNSAASAGLAIRSGLVQAEETITRMQSGFSSLVEKIKLVATTLARDVYRNISLISSQIQVIVAGPMASITGALQGMGRHIGEYVQEIGFLKFQLEYSTGAASSLYQRIVSVGNSLKEWVVNGMSARNAFSAISGVAQSMVAKVSSGFEEWAWNIRAATSNLTGTQKVIAAVQSGFQQIISGAGKGLAAPIQGFNAVLGDVMQKLGPFSKILASRDLASGVVAAGLAASFFVKTLFSANITPLESQLVFIFKLTGKMLKDNNPVKVVTDMGLALQDTKGALAKIVQSFEKIKTINQQLRATFDGMVRQVQFVTNAQDAFAPAMGMMGPTITTMWDPQQGVLLANAFEQMTLSIEMLSRSGGASEGVINSLLEEIKRLAIVTSLAPTQIAELSESLMKMGMSAEDTQAALEGIVRTAEATKTPVQQLAPIIGAVLSQFQLEGKDATRVGDVLAKVANNAATDIVGLGSALKYAGARANIAGQSFEETVAIIGLLQTAGLQGSTAGTSSANLMTQLANAAGKPKGRDLLAQIGLSDTDVLDQKGNLSILDVLPKIKKGVEELEKTVEGARAVPSLLNDIFGMEAGKALNAMLSQNAETIEKIVSAAKTAEGFSMESSENQLQGASGAAKLLEGSIASFSQTVGEVYLPVLEVMIRKTTAMINVFLGMPEVIQKMIIGFFALSPVLVMHMNLIKVSTYINKTWGLIKAANTVLLSGEAITLDRLNTALKGNVIWQKAATAWNAISSRAVKVLRGEYSLLILKQELWAKRSVAWKMAQSWFDAQFGSTVAAIKTMMVQLGLLIGVIWTFQSLTERSPGAKLANDMDKAGKEIQSIIDPTKKATNELGGLWEIINRFRELGLAEGARENLARLAQLGGGNTDPDSEYGNQSEWKRGGASFLTGRQLGNQKAQFALGRITDQITPLFQESINLRMSKDTSSQYVERVKELRTQLEEVLKLLQSINVDENTTTGKQTKKLIDQIENEIKAHEARVYSIENGIDINRDMVKSLEEVTRGYEEAISAIERQSLAEQKGISDRLFQSLDTGDGNFTEEDAKISYGENELLAIKDKIEATKQALFELDIARVEKTEETLGEITKKEQELQSLLIQLEMELNNKRLQLSQDRINDVKSENEKKLSDVEWYEQKAIAIIKYALAKGQITRKEYDNYMNDQAKAKLEQRNKLITEELKTLEDMFKSGEIAAQQYHDRRDDLTNELHKIVSAMADFEIERQKDVAKAYEKRLSIMSEEISLQESLNELALVDAESTGASEIELGEMKLAQLQQMQEMKRQELELQLAKNLASAEDIELQQKLNDLILKRFESDASKELKQAQFQVQDAQLQEQEAQNSEWLQRIQDSANAKSEMIGMEAESLEVINELRSQEIELIDRAKESLQLKHDAITAEEEAIIASLERQKSLADELLQLQAETGEEAALMKDELEAQLGLGTYTDYFGKTYKKKGDASEVEILERKYEIEKQIAEAKEAQLVRQHELQSQLLDMETQQNLLNAEQAIQEAEINELKASQAIIEAQAALDVLKLEQGIAESQAKQNESAEGVASAYRGRASAAREASQEAKAQSEEDKLQMQLAQGKLGIAQQQMELARSQTGHAREQKQILEDQSVVREKILDIQQETEKSELNATNEVADRAGRLAIATAESKSNSEGMANAMGKAAESAGQTADAMGKAADAAGSAASAMSVDRRNPSSSSTTSSYANVDLADIAKRELELAAKIAEASGNTAQAQAIRDQIASENKKMELKALQDEAAYLREQRALYQSERQRFIDQTIALSKSFQRATSVPTLRNFEQEAATKAEKFFGGSGGIGDLSGGKSMQLLGEALQGFNPQIQKQQMVAQQQMGEAIESGNKEVGGKLDKINDTIGKAMSRPTEVNISGSEDIGGDVSKTLKALQIAQR